MMPQFIPSSSYKQLRIPPPQHHPPHTHTHTHTHTPSGPSTTKYTRTHAYAHTRAYACARARAHTHTHGGIISLRLFFSFFFSSFFFPFKFAAPLSFHAPCYLQKLTPKADSFEWSFVTLSRPFQFRLVYRIMPSVIICCIIMSIHICNI